MTPLQAAGLAMVDQTPAPARQGFFVRLRRALAAAATFVITGMIEEE